jgi:hypothetical protein
MVITRHAARSPPMPSPDVDMEDVNAPLALPAPSYLEVVDYVPTRAIEPANSTPPTL